MKNLLLLVASVLLFGSASAQTEVKIGAPTVNIKSQGKIDADSGMYSKGFRVLMSLDCVFDPSGMSITDSRLADKEVVEILLSGLAYGREWFSQSGAVIDFSEFFTCDGSPCDSTGYGGMTITVIVR